jgi:hypothetical protein
LRLRENNAGKKRQKEGNTACIVLDVKQENKKHLDDEKSSDLNQSANSVTKHFAGISINDSVSPLHDFSHPISTIFIRHM